jgi:hypothetical protein
MRSPPNVSFLFKNQLSRHALPSSALDTFAWADSSLRLWVLMFTNHAETPQRLRLARLCNLSLNRDREAQLRRMELRVCTGILIGLAQHVLGDEHAECFGPRRMVLGMCWVILGIDKIYNLVQQTTLLLNTSDGEYVEVWDAEDLCSISQFSLAHKTVLQDHSIFDFTMLRFR